MRINTRVALYTLVTAGLVGCGDSGKGIEIENYPNADNMLEIDSDHLKVIRVSDDGSRASIAIGESETHWCDITINSSSLKNGEIGINTLDGTGSELEAECQWGAGYFVQSSKHNTSVALHLEGKQVTADLLLVDPSSGKYLALTAIDLQITSSSGS